jgi:hypothetical protein
MFYADRIASLVELKPGEVLRLASIPSGVAYGIVIGKHDTDFEVDTSYSDNDIMIFRLRSDKK